MRYTITLALGFVWLLSGCQPADVKTKTIRERLESGEVLEFAEPGWRYKGCKEDHADWTDLRVGPDTVKELGERSRIVVGTQQSRLSPGLFNCYRIGSVLAVSPYKYNGTGVPGNVQVTKISWVHINHLKKSLMKGRYFATNEGFYAAKDEMRFLLKRAPDRFNDVVSILEFRYLNGSAYDEKAIIEKAQQSDSDDGYEETKGFGDSLNSRCIDEDGQPKEKFIRIPDPLSIAVRERLLQSAYALGRKHCFIEGQLITVKAAWPSEDVIATVRLSKIKRVRRAFLSSSHFKLNGLAYPVLKNEIDREAQSNPEEYIMIVDFQNQSMMGDTRHN